MNAALSTTIHGAAGAGQLKPILSDVRIFGSDLYEAGIGERIEELFLEEPEGPGLCGKPCKSTFESDIIKVSTRTA